MKDMNYDNKSHWDAIQRQMDAACPSCGKVHGAEGHKMSDMAYAHMQHEQSESPKYERMEEKAVKMMKAMKGSKNKY